SSPPRTRPWRRSGTCSATTVSFRGESRARTVPFVSTLERARCRLKAHPLALDAALAAGVLVCMVVGSFADSHGGNGVTCGVRTPDLLSLLLITIGAVALVFRRIVPKTVLAVTGTVSLVESVTGDPRAPVAMSAVVALYTVASTTDRTTTWRVGLLTMTVL